MVWHIQGIPLLSKKVDCYLHEDIFGGTSPALPRAFVEKHVEHSSLFLSSKLVIFQKKNVDRQLVPKFKPGRAADCSQKVMVCLRFDFIYFKKNQNKQIQQASDNAAISLEHAAASLSGRVVSHWERLAFYCSGLVVCTASGPDNFSHPLVYYENKTHWRDKDACAGEISTRTGLRNT